jgi:hypothetical protein
MEVEAADVGGGRGFVVEQRQQQLLQSLCGAGKSEECGLRLRLRLRLEARQLNQQPVWKQGQRATLSGK